MKDNRLNAIAKELIPPLFVKAFKRLSHPSITKEPTRRPIELSPAPIEYQYKKFSILLPSDHKLPLYQRDNVKYDRFLPHLAKYVGNHETIIDVGANCGDTLAGMVETNEKAAYICIEPDDAFFDYLESNIKRIKGHIPDISIQAVKSLVGKSVSNVSLEGVGGTKHAVFNNDHEGGHTARTLDDISNEFSFPNIKLLKTDVDGFDYDVIDSAINLLSEQQPIVFFECQTDSEYQKVGYENTIKQLKSIGYVDWVLFDNFGEVMLKTTEVELIFQLMNYIWQQNAHSATRTIFYYDILASTENDRPLIEKALEEY